jgi:hypothetical protein
VPHRVLLSPLEHPVIYAFWFLHLFSSLICIWVSVHFFRQKRERWWLVVAFAFALPWFVSIIHSLLNGLPPLPSGMESQLALQPQPASSMGYTGSVIKSTAISSNLDTVTPLMAIALSWAYLADKKRRSESTAQT